MTEHEASPPGRPSFFRRPAAPAGGPNAPPAAPPAPPAAPPRPPGPMPPLSPPPAPPLPPAGPLTAGPREQHRLTFHGSGGTLFGIHIVNVLLTLVTLGVYYFWAKSRVRAYLLSQTELAGDRFAWHGTGKEMLFGFLRAVLIFGVPLGVLMLLRDVLTVPMVVKIVAGALVPIVFVLLIPMAMVGARRYRLTRISWRGIRFSFRGRPREFVRIFVVGSILSSVTFGLYYPFFETRRYAFMTEHSWFGNRRLGFDGRGWDLFGPFLVMALLVPFTFGLSFVWYLARKRRYFWSHTTAGRARFRSSVTGLRLLLLYLGNLLLLVFTLGLAWPWAKVRTARFTFTYLVLEGPLDLEDIQQDAQAASSTGEGLAGLFDFGTGFDFG